MLLTIIEVPGDLVIIALLLILHVLILVEVHLLVQEEVAHQVVLVEEVNQERYNKMKLSDIILERTDRPKAVIMAGGAGSGKTYLLNQLQLGSLPLFNPDTYVEDPDHPY